MFMFHAGNKHCINCRTRDGALLWAATKLLDVAAALIAAIFPLCVNTQGREGP